MKKILFKKYSGAGNDFVLIDENENSDLIITQELIIKICDRRNGIGADGVFILKESNIADFGIDFYNADGKPGSLCGNGSRCVLKYFSQKKQIINLLISFEFKKTLYSGIVYKNSLVEFKMPQPYDFKEQLNIDFLDQTIIGEFVNTGSPHVVVFIDKFGNENLNIFNKDFCDIDVEAIGKELRYHNLFAPEGTNVNFVKIENNSLYIRTFERGVEAETLACGTGSVAAAILAFKKSLIKKPFNVIPKSNDVLNVEFDYDYKNFENIKLLGPAELIFTGEFY